MNRVLRYLLAALLLAGIAPALGADVGADYSQGPGGYYRKDDRSGPYVIGPDGAPRLLSSAGSGTQEQDVSETRALSAATVGAQQTYTLNGQATFSFNFAGLTASGATVSFFQSNDWNGTGGTFTAVSEVNTGTGTASLTRSVDGQSAVGVEGARAVRVQVTTPGTGTIILATNISVRSRYAAIRSPVPGLATTSVAMSPVPSVVRGAAALLGKASAGNMYGFGVTASTQAGFLAILDAAAVPAAGAAITPTECLPVGAGGALRSRHDIPDRYATGIVAVATTSCSTCTAMSPAPLVLSLVVQ